MPRNRFIAVGSLLQRDLDVIGSGFRRAFPSADTDGFASLLIEIDRAEQRNRAALPAVDREAALDTPG
jgi:hypothetical protein